MNLEHEMQNALKPLDDQGLVHMVVLPDEPVLPLAIVFLNTDDPESYRSEIEHLLEDAGLAHIHVVVQHNPTQVR